MSDELKAKCDTNNGLVSLADYTDDMERRMEAAHRLLMKELSSEQPPCSLPSFHTLFSTFLLSFALIPSRCNHLAVVGNRPLLQSTASPTQYTHYTAYSSAVAVSSSLHLRSYPRITHVNFDCVRLPFSAHISSTTLSSISANNMSVMLLL